ncbi:hypothetical protein ACC702_39835, partial [Rhizobium ruizarguesonis]
CLDDPRVGIHQGYVGEAIRAGKGAYDAVLLDVYNGPDGLTRKSNDRLYDFAGLRAASGAQSKAHAEPTDQDPWLPVR